MWRSSLRLLRTTFADSKPVQSNVVADTTFSYRTLPWLTSEGHTVDYKFVAASPPEYHPLPASEQQHFVLVSSLDVCTAGKEDVRPLAKELSDLGHWSYMLEWPGWTTDGVVNWALFRCKLEHLREEYEDFWSDILTTLKRDHDSVRVIACGDLAASIVAQPCQELSLPLRKIEVTSGYIKRWSPRWANVLADTLQSEGRVAKLIQRWYFSHPTIKKLRKPVLRHDGVTIEMLEGRHKRPRPLTHTDMALICGYLDVQREVLVAESTASHLAASGTWGT